MHVNKNSHYLLFSRVFKFMTRNLLFDFGYLLTYAIEYKGVWRIAKEKALGLTRAAAPTMRGFLMADNKSIALKSISKQIYHQLAGLVVFSFVGVH